MTKFYSKEDEYKEVLKSGEAPEKLIYKEFITEEVRAINDEALTIEFVISSNSIDRMHDTIDQEGWDLKAFKKNPVVLWAHDQSQPPVAKAIPKSLKVDGKKLKATAQFMPADVSEFSYMIFQMYKMGFMSATSVGFRPLEWSFAEDDKRPYGVNFTKQELLEFSCVPVPANADALMGAKSMGLNTRPLKSWVENILDNWKDDNGLMVPRSSIEALQKSMTARVKLMKPIEDIMAKEIIEENKEVVKEASEVVEKAVVEAPLEVKEVVVEAKETTGTNEVPNPNKGDSSNSSSTISAEHNPQIHAAFSLHSSAMVLHKHAMDLHSKASKIMKEAFTPNSPADGDGTDYANGNKTVEEIIAKAASTSGKEQSGDDAAAEHNPPIDGEKLQVAHALHKSASHIAKQAMSIHTKACGMIKSIVDPDNDGDDDTTDPNDQNDGKKSFDPTKLALAEKKELLTKLVEAISAEDKEFVFTVEKELPSETTIEVKEVEKEVFSITLFEDSVDKEEDSVKFDEVKAVLAGLDFGDLIEKSLKTKLEV